MKTKNETESAFESLRRQAEQVLRQRGTTASDGDDLEWLRLLSEIEVYQVELELQNQELNRSTKELEAARNDYFELYDSAPVAFVTLDSNGVIQRRNKAADRLPTEFGNLPEEFLFARAVHPADQAAFFFFLNKIAANKNQSSCELRLRGKCDRPLWVQFMAKSIFDMKKRFGGWRLAMIDVTERKELEHKMRHARDELERRAGQLSRLSVELTMAEHRERRRLAERMHDNLQQLLMGARYNLDAVKTDIVPDGQPAFQNAYDLILKSLEASRNLIAELCPPVLFRFGLPEVLEWLARWMKKTHALDVEIRLDIEACPLEEAIKVLMFQSVRELLFNVKKHAKTNSARVAATCRDGRLSIAVSDAGTGFDAKNLWKSDIESDKGFGLFSVRERLLLLKGTFDIESSPDRGTTVTLTVPVLADAPSPPGTAMEAKEGSQAHCPARAPERKSGNKIRLVLAEDHLMMRNALCAMLSMHPDIEIAGEASNGEEAVALARRIRPDVILMDIDMPKMNGMDATRIIHSELPDIRIVGLSMHEAAEKAAAMKQAGASEYLCKSSGADIFLAAIRCNV